VAKIEHEYDRLLEHAAHDASCVGVGGKSKTSRE
jgi:hypothetical protein